MKGDRSDWRVWGSTLRVDKWGMLQAAYAVDQEVFMAPFIGPDRASTLKQLRSLLPGRKVPITLGRYAPQAVVEEEDGRWRLIPLVMNQQAAREAGERALANGDMWMPEMEWQFLEKGEPLLDAGSAKELAQLLEDMEWKWS